MGIVQNTIFLFLFGFLALAPAVGVCTENAPKLLTADELYDLLLEYAPKRAGAADFFNGLDAASRKYYNGLIENNPRLWAAASAGLASRNELLRSLQADLPSGSLEWDVATHRVEALQRLLEAARKANQKMEEAPLSPSEVRSRTREEVNNRSRLPFLSESQLVRQSESIRFDFKKTLNRWEYRTVPKPKVEANAVEEWKETIKSLLTKIRIQNLKIGIKEALLHQAFQVGAFKTRGGGFLNQYYLANREQVTPLDRLDDMEWIPAENLSEAPAGRVEFLPQARHATAVALKAIPGVGDVFAGVLQYPAYSTIFLGNEPLFFVRKGSELFSLDSEALGSLTNLLDGLFSRGSQLNPAVAKWRARASLERVLEDLSYFIKKDKSRSFPELHSVLSRYEQDWEKAHGVELASQIVRPLKDSNGTDWVAGLEWATHYQARVPPSERDQRANPKKSLGNKVSSLTDKLPNLVRSILYTALTWGAVYGYSDLVHRAATSSNKPKPAASQKEEGIPNSFDFSDVHPAFNKSTDSPATKLPLFRILKVGEAPLPRFFDIPNFEQLERATVLRAIPLAQGRNSFFVVSAVPAKPKFSPSHRGYFLPLFRMEGHELASLTLIAPDTNTLLKPGEMTLLMDKASEHSFVQVPGSTEGVTLILEYAQTGRSYERRDYPGFHDLDPVKLQHLQADLDRGGYARIAMAQRDDVRLWSGVADLQSLAETFSLPSHYEKTKNGAKEASQAEPWYAPFRPFLNHGQYCSQCDGGNRFFRAYLSKYYDQNPDVRVVNQSTFAVDEKTLVLTPGQFHLRTEVEVENGKFRWIVDATPNGPNETPTPRRSEEFLEDPRRKKVHVVSEKDRLPKLPPLPTLEERANALQLLAEKVQALIAVVLAHRIHGEKLPSSNALHLARTARNFSEGRISVAELEHELTERFGEAIPVFEDEFRSDLALSEVIRTEKERMDKMAQKLRDGVVQGMELWGDARVLHPVRDLLDFVGKNDWRPIPTDPCSRHFDALADKRRKG